MSTFGCPNCLLRLAAENTDALDADLGDAADETVTMQKREPHSEIAVAPVGRSGSHENYGNHKIVRPHARGGMGQISIAHDENLGREVALKELFEKATAHNETVRRFFDEAKITAKLEHPGIIPVHSFGTDAKGNPYYTMKFVRGRSLKDIIKDYHALPEKAKNKPKMFRELIRRLAWVCQTMSFAHEQGIIHRDLKPANIMIGKHGETLVMDWGLAKPFANDHSR